MEKKKDVWKPTCNRFVAYLDIMGFKEMVLRKSNKFVYKTLISLRPAIEVTEAEIEFRIKEPYVKNITKITKTVTFSDSIILITNDDSDTAALNIFNDVGRIIRSAFKEEIPMKGAIAYGKLTADIKNSLYFGRPLIDAFELHNELLLYGVALHHTMQKHLNKLDIMAILNKQYIYQYPLPMKSGRINHFIVDWTVLEKDANSSWDLVNKLYNNVSGSPRIYVDNTLEFVRWVTAKKAELKKKKKA